MDAVTKDVKRLVRKELANANRNFRMFASPHEGWAVIREGNAGGRNGNDSVESSD